MPFKPWVRAISPLAWCLGMSAAANVVTMAAVLYIALGTPEVYVSDGSITAFTGSHGLSIDDRYPVHVVVVGK
jgi:hypothetical protein